MAHPTDPNTGQPIYRGAPGVGLRNVGSYQVSGEPWISGSDGQAGKTTKRFKLPYVAREISVYHDAGSAGGTCRVHFVSGNVLYSFSGSGNAPLVDYTGAGNVFRGLHYVDVPKSNTLTFKAKCKEIYVSNDHASTAITYRVMADLTNVPVSRMYHLTGSGHTDEGE